MNFKLDDNLICRVHDICDRIEKKKKFVYKNRTGDEYRKTTVSDKTLLVKDNNSNMIPSERTKYIYNAALKIQSVNYITKYKDIKYCPQVLLKECCYEVFFDNRKINPRLKRTNKPKPELESESEEKFNEDTYKITNNVY